MKRLLLFLTYIIIFCSGVVLAAPIEAGADNPAAVNRQYIDQFKDLRIEQKVIETVPEDLEKEKQLKEQNQIPPETQQNGVIYNPKFRLNDIEFRGNTVYSDRKLKAMANTLIGREIYLEDIMNYTIKISRFYQKNGYLTTYASIAPQEIQNGVVVVDVNESRVGGKKVLGNFWVRKFYISNLATGGTHLSKGKVFNVKQLQGAMKQLNKEAYMKTSAAIEKNAENETLLEFDIQDRFPLNFDASWDDYGRNVLGRQRATLTAGMDNLTGFGDKAYGGVILGPHSTGALTGYQIPVSTYGTKLSFDYSHSTIKPKGELAPLNLEGTANSYSLKLTHPFVNTAVTDVTAYAMFDFIDSRTDIPAIGASISDYILRVPRLGVNAMHDGETGRWIGNLGVDLGIDGWGSSPNVKGGPQSSFQKIIASLARVERIPHNMLGIVRVNGQYAFQSLYSAEQMFLGGPYSIRGYQPTEILGDYGVAGSVELRFPIPFLDKIKKHREFFQAMQDRFKLLVFYDWGYVNDHRNIYSYPKHYLHSTGVGANIVLFDGLNAQVGVGFPLGQRSLGEESARMYFSINTELDRLALRPKSHVKKSKS